MSRKEDTDDVSFCQKVEEMIRTKKVRVCARTCTRMFVSTEKSQGIHFYPFKLLYFLFNFLKFLRMFGTIITK